MELERETDRMRTENINSHIDRLQTKACDPQAGVLFTNMVATLERVADHAVNIAYSISEDVCADIRGKSVKAVPHIIYCIQLCARRLFNCANGY